MSSEDPVAEQETTSYNRAKDAGLFRDYLSNIRPAGKSTTIFEDTAERDLKSEIYFKRPDTPPEQRKYRKNLIPGEINVHYGLVDQQLPKGKDGDEFRYGIKSDRGETVETTLKAGLKFGIAEYKNLCAESVYESNKKEPLGRGYNRGHELPKICREENSDKFVGFGLKSKDVDDGKIVIFPRGVKPDDEETRKRYVYTHGSFEPGQMFKRNYEWPKEVTDNENFRFGGSEKESGGEIGGVKAALNFEKDAAGKMNKTKIASSTLSDYRSVAHDGLGCSKNYCQGPDVRAKVPPKGFGIVSAGANDTAAACIQGTYNNSLESQMPDKDLGKCMIEGRRNVSKDPNRIFGVPSVRVDIPAPNPLKRSVADNQNYGDEVGAGPILNPQRFEIMGVQDKEFLIRRSKPECKDILKCAGYAMSDSEFDRCWEGARALFDDDIELVSLDSILYLKGAEIENKVDRKLRGS